MRGALPPAVDYDFDGEWPEEEPCKVCGPIWEQVMSKEEKDGEQDGRRPIATVK